MPETQVSMKQKSRSENLKRWVAAGPAERLWHLDLTDSDNQDETPTLTSFSEWDASSSKICVCSLEKGSYPIQQDHTAASWDDLQDWS